MMWERGWVAVVGVVGLDGDGVGEVGAVRIDAMMR